MYTAFLAHSVFLRQNKSTTLRRIKRSDFLTEARTLSTLDDLAVARVLAIVDHPPTVVLEFGERGDLKTFLKQLAGPPSAPNDFDERSLPPGIRFVAARTDSF
jgi:hypothetical protein